jgi:hypothetical protein
MMNREEPSLVQSFSVLRQRQLPVDREQATPGQIDALTIEQ